MRKFFGPEGPVHAELIQSVTQNEKDVVTADGARYSFSAEWRRQNEPRIGDWLVFYENGIAQVIGGKGFSGDFKEEADNPPGKPPPGALPHQLPVQQERDMRAQQAKEREKHPDQVAAEQEEKEAEEKRRERSFRAGSSVQAQQARENAQTQLQQIPDHEKPDFDPDKAKEEADKAKQEREQREQKEQADAEQQRKTEADDGSRRAQQGIRQEGGHSAESGEGVQQSGQRRPQTGRT
jgi:hypothetical protein